MNAKINARRPEFGADVKLIDVATEDVVYQGVPLTDKRVEEIVENLRAVSEANLIPGGKSLSAPGVHSPRVSYRVPEDVLDAAERQSDAEGITLSKLGRKALIEYLEHHAAV